MNKSDFKKLLNERVVILDGAMGSELRKRGYLDDVSCVEELNIKFPERIQEIFRNYLEAGTEMLLTDTLGANRRLLAEYGLEGKTAEINSAAVKVARETASKYGALVAGDMGPLGAYLTPLGPLSFEEAYDLFAEQAKAFASAGADLIFIETMADIREVKAALIAAKDNFPGPVMVNMTFTSDGTTVTGTDILTYVSVAESVGADAIGMNCSVGPESMLPLIKILAKHTSLPVSFKPNAGMPKLVNRQTFFPGTPEEFSGVSVEAFNAGVNLLGGCCGTNPDFIRALSKEIKGKKPVQRKTAEKFLISSRTRAVDLYDEKELVKVGERINPTNRKKFQDELGAGNFATIRREAQGQAKSGAKILDVNMGLPGADEPALMKKAVSEIQEAVQVPLCLDSSSTGALEEGLKACAGKPVINSVNGDEPRLNVIFPLAKRYGAAVIGLCVDERGLPKNSAERLEIAERILSSAKKHGFPENEVIFDYLTLAASAMSEGIRETLAAIKESRKRWPANKTILGVSNVSFGLPNRQVLNSTFLKLAREAGLDLAILNPHEDWSADDKEARNLLVGGDPKGEKYIAKHGNAVKKQPAAQKDMPAGEKLYNAVLEGAREDVPSLIKQVLASGKKPLEIANDILLGALNEVGSKFKTKEYFLPQVILAAEAAQAAFAEIKPLLKRDAAFKSGKIVLATVKGDVHDIGKNIVAAVLESHGWEVIDLGKNVDAEKIVETAVSKNSGLIGLSALMTTTMLEMENVVRIRNEKKLPVKILVGGAPVTDKFSKEIGADGYARDAVEAAEIAKLLVSRD
ncbi:MAG: homocysteine S-methyltransferase family protein [Elusimicrobiota bacterium]